MNSSNKPELDPILPSEWDEEILDALGAFPGSLNFVLSQWNQESGDLRGMHILGLFAHYPKLAKAYMGLNQHVAAGSSLPVRIRELLILRTSWLRKLDYEYTQHIVLARRAGITDEEIQQIQTGSSATDWSSEDSEILLVAEELRQHAAISNGTMQNLKNRYTTQQIMDMIFLVGCYDLLGVAIKSFGIPVEDALTELHQEVCHAMFGNE